MRIGHPNKLAAWTDLRPGLDYSKLDESGIIRVGELVDESTVLVSRYIQSRGAQFRDASVTPQVWTHGRVESVVITVDNQDRRLVKIRVTQDRQPELGDKFSNRHGQKGTIGMFVRGHDMPRTEGGLVPDLIYNPHSIPSRMTIAQLLEQLFGKVAVASGAVGDATTFMSEENPHYNLAKVLTDQYGFEPYGNEILYNGQTGEMMPTSIFICPIYKMRLKHMVEDKWNARAEGRREQKTHQPTGGRGNQGGLRIGEMERDALVAHGGASFIDETYMKRADGFETVVCNSCGTVPIYNESENFYFCSLCDGPAVFVGDSVSNLSLVPPPHKSDVSFSRVRIPYAMKLLDQELGTFMNIGMRVGTAKYLRALPRPSGAEVGEARGKDVVLPELVLPDVYVPERQEAPKEPVVAMENIIAMGAEVLGAATEALEEAEGAEAAAAQAATQAATQQPAVVQATQGVLASTAAVPEGIGAVPPAVQPATLISIAVPQGPPQPVIPDETIEPPDESMNLTAPAQPIPTMTLQTPVPGAPATFFVDTGERAMNSMGLSAAAPTRSLRSMVPGSTRKNVAARGGPSAAPPPGAKLNIIKQG